MCIVKVEVDKRDGGIEMQDVVVKEQPGSQAHI